MYLIQSTRQKEKYIEEIILSNLFNGRCKNIQGILNDNGKSSGVTIRLINNISIRFSFLFFPVLFHDF